MKSIYLIIFPILLIAGLSFASDSTFSVTGTFSNLEYNEKAGTYFGTEILILKWKYGYYVLFEKAEGEIIKPIRAKADIKGNVIEFTINEGKYNYGNFKGKISVNQLIGKFETQEIIKLPRQDTYTQ